MRLTAPLRVGGVPIRPRVGVFSLLLISWLAAPSPITVKIRPEET